MKAARLALAYPWTTGVLVVSAWSLAASAASWWPVTPLRERAGFAEAVLHLTSTAAADRFVLVWPPEQAAALDAIPAQVRAADALPIESAGRRRYRRIVVLGPRGVDVPREIRDPASLERRTFDEVDVVEVTYGDAESIRFDLRDELARAKISRQDASGVRACDEPHASGGLRCRDAPEWNYVGPTVLRVANQDWPSVWVHPVAGATLVIEASELELGDQVVLEAALSDDAARTPDGAPVTLTLAVGATTRTLVRSNAPGVARLALPTVRGSRAPVRLTVTAPRDGRRHLGVNLRVVEGGAP